MALYDLFLIRSISDQRREQGEVFKFEKKKKKKKKIKKQRQKEKRKKQKQKNSPKPKLCNAHVSYSFK